MNPFVTSLVISLFCCFFCGSLFAWVFRVRKVSERNKFLEGRNKFLEGRNEVLEDEVEVWVRKIKDLKITSDDRKKVIGELKESLIEKEKQVEALSHNYGTLFGFQSRIKESNEKLKTQVESTLKELQETSDLLSKTYDIVSKDMDKTEFQKAFSKSSNT